jgi:L-asparaginase
VRALLERAGASTDDLECGAEHGSKLRHNCSGKHAGFLFLAAQRGWPKEGYRLPDHPVQQGVLALVAEVVGRDLEPAVDGCGVPTFALSLTEMARAFAGLVRGEPAGADAVVRAMTAHPRLIGGPKAVDTLVMQALPGSVAKRGAEGVLCVGLADGAGVALKVDDGANRAAYAAAGLVLRIAELQERPVRNSRGETVGTISATV